MRLYVRALNNEYPINGLPRDVIEFDQAPTFEVLYERLGFLPSERPHTVIEDREPVLKSLRDTLPVGVELFISRKNPRRGVYAVTLMN
jgi:hypothetical protein